MITLIHHSACRDDHAFPPNSLTALDFCLAAGARIVEVDVSPLAAGDFLIAHEGELARFSTGRGRVAHLNPAQAGELRLVWQGETTPYAPMLLSQVVALMASHRGPVELQLDLKEHVPLRRDILTRLSSMLRPIRDRVRVTSGADWALRGLRAVDPDLPLGFDPLFYLGWDEEPGRPAGELPLRRGAFGYWDEHPLANERWGSAAEYLRQRAEALWAQAPRGCDVWYLSAHLLAAALDDGFDWIDFLHRRGAEVDAWTLDPRRAVHVDLARRLAAAGVDRITTDFPVALAHALGGDVLF